MTNGPQSYLEMYHSVQHIFQWHLPWARGKLNCILPKYKLKIWVCMDPLTYSFPTWEINVFHTFWITHENIREGGWISTIYVFSRVFVSHRTIDLSLANASFHFVSSSRESERGIKAFALRLWGSLAWEYPTGKISPQEFIERLPKSLRIH